MSSEYLILLAEKEELQRKLGIAVEAITKAEDWIDNWLLKDGDKDWDTGKETADMLRCALEKLK